MSRWKKELQQEEPSYTVSKTETFFTRHVRLITCLVCIAVFMVLFWPIAMPEMHKFSHEGDIRPKMTVNDVVRISGMGNRFTEAEAAKYVGIQTDTDYENYYYIDVEPHYQVLAVFDKDTKLLLFCQLSNQETDEKIDLMKDDVEAFLK